MMKIFVCDHGWAGAEIYVSKSKETAVEYFRSSALEKIQAHIDQLTKENNPHLLKLAEDNKIETSSSKFDLRIQEYPCKEGTIFWTDGVN
jgi:hypothetical protein